MRDAALEDIQEWLSKHEGQGEYTIDTIEDYIKYLNYSILKFKTDAEKQYEYSKDENRGGSTVDITITCRPVAAIFDFI